MGRRVACGLAVLVSGMSAAVSANALDLDALWDHARPAVTEARMREALATARGDDALILRTQIARTHGLLRDFERARVELAEIEPALAGAGAQARVRHALELGRTWSSAVHPPASQTDEARAAARAAFQRAIDLSREAALDDLTVDALHMMAFVDTAPAEQLRWGRAALDVIEHSSQPAARRWEGSIRNNVGYALHQLARYPEALAQFEAALQARRRDGASPKQIRIARWMVAWTLRALGRVDEAIESQQQLEREGAAAGEPDPYVFEELALLHRARGDEARAAEYERRRAALTR